MPCRTGACALKFQGHRSAKWSGLGLRRCSSDFVAIAFAERDMSGEWWRAWRGLAGAACGRRAGFSNISIPFYHAPTQPLRRQPFVVLFKVQLGTCMDPIVRLLRRLEPRRASSRTKTKGTFRAASRSRSWAPLASSGRALEGCSARIGLGVGVAIALSLSAGSSTRIPESARRLASYAARAFKTPFPSYPPHSHNDRHARHCQQATSRGTAYFYCQPLVSKAAKLGLYSAS